MERQLCTETDDRANGDIRTEHDVLSTELTADRTKRESKWNTYSTQKLLIIHAGENFRTETDNRNIHVGENLRTETDNRDIHVGENLRTETDNRDIHVGENLRTETYNRRTSCFV